MRRQVNFKVDEDIMDIIMHLMDRWGTTNMSRVVRRALQIAFLLSEFVATGEVDFYVRAKRIAGGGEYHGDLLKPER